MKKAISLLGLLALLLLQGCGCHREETDTSAATNVDMSGDQASAPAAHNPIKPMNIKGTPQATREGNSGQAGSKIGR